MCAHIAAFSYTTVCAVEQTSRTCSRIVAPCDGDHTVASVASLIAVSVSARALACAVRSRLVNTRCFETAV